jgi:hypothetical protein
MGDSDNLNSLVLHPVDQLKGESLKEIAPGSMGKAWPAFWSERD